MCVCVYTSRTYILCFAPGLERHDNTGGVVVSQILHLAKFLGQERESEQVMFLCQGSNTSSSLCFLGRTRKWVFPRINTLRVKHLWLCSRGPTLEQFCLTEGIKSGWKYLLNLASKWIYVNIAGCHHIKYYERFFELCANLVSQLFLYFVLKSDS